MANEIICERERRFVNIAEYCRLYGTSPPTVRSAIKRGELPYITSESGRYLVDTQPQGASIQPIIDKLERQERRIEALCKHLGVVGGR